MRIRKKNQNEYILAGDVWVRNFTKEGVPFCDINHITRSKDYGLLLGNQVNNTTRHIARIDLENFSHPKVIIVSDGYGFSENQIHLASLPPDVTVIGINGALAKWNLLGKNSSSRAMNYYVVNNPYDECMSFFPKKNRYFPKCVSSIRTNSGFVRSYKGVMYQYVPVAEEGFTGPHINANWQIDDYRNPVCAAIGLSHQFGAEKIMLFCCDDAYDHEKPGSVKIGDKWMYQNQIACQQVVDGCLYWMKNRTDYNTEIKIFGNGPEYKNGVYIKSKEIAEFFSAD